jgi:biotin-dependent carboxylase-like uncharacterized protein
MAVKIIIAGAFTTVQDTGRYGYRDRGIGVSGVMDNASYRQANYLVGNENGEAVLEFTFFGATIEFTKETIFALTGADMGAMLNETEIPTHRPILANEGDILTLSMAKSGVRAYLAFAGGIDVPLVLGSRSTNVKCSMGGFEGRTLKAGDILEIGKAVPTFEEIKGRVEKPTEYGGEIVLRVIEGPQVGHFTEKGIETLYGETFTVSDQSDRMGYRLSGKAIEHANGADIVSDGIALGSIQVPANGQPIILLADRQTTGGYAKIACVCLFDIPKLAQARPGDKIHFQKITMYEAQEINTKSNISWV